MQCDVVLREITQTDVLLGQAQSLCILAARVQTQHHLFWVKNCLNQKPIQNESKIQAWIIIKAALEELLGKSGEIRQAEWRPMKDCDVEWRHVTSSDVTRMISFAKTKTEAIRIEKKNQKPAALNKRDFHSKKKAETKTQKQKQKQMDQRI